MQSPRETKTNPPTAQDAPIAWPARIKDKGGIRWQFHHMIDIVPTILEVHGNSADAPSKRAMQYFEMFGDRAIYQRRLDRRYDDGRMVVSGQLSMGYLCRFAVRMS